MLIKRNLCFGFGLWCLGFSWFKIWAKLGRTRLKDELEQRTAQVAENQVGKVCPSINSLLCLPPLYFFTISENICQGIRLVI